MRPANLRFLCGNQMQMDLTRALDRATNNQTDICNYFSLMYDLSSSEVESIIIILPCRVFSENNWLSVSIADTVFNECSATHTCKRSASVEK